MTDKKIRIESMDDMAPPTEGGKIKVEVKFLGRDGFFAMWFEDFDKTTEKKWRSISTNRGRNVGRIRHKDVEEGDIFLFTTKFAESSIDWNRYSKEPGKENEIIGNGLTDKGYANEKEYFLNDPIGVRYIKPAVDKYYQIVTPDASDTKE